MSDVGPITRLEVIDLGEGDYVCNPPCRGVILGTAGVLNIIVQKEVGAQLTGPLPAGYNPIRIREIKVANTTATGITVYW